MPRLDRRLRLFRTLPACRFDPAQVRIEAAPRERAARMVRGALRAGRPVIVRHQRWAAMRWFLQDVAAELAVGAPPLDARVVDVGGEGAPWERVPELLARGLGVAAGRGVAPTSAQVFFDRAAMTLRRGRSVRRRKALLCLDAEAMGWDNLQLLCDAWAAARAEMTPGTAPMLAVTCAAGEHALRLDDALVLSVGDPTDDEAVQLAAELFGPDGDLAREAVRVLGPVPAFLLTAARLAGARGAGALVDAVAPLHRELGRALELVSPKIEHAARLERLAHEGPLPTQPEVDRPLQIAGLVTLRARRGLPTTQLRTPLLRGLLGIEAR